MVSLFCVGRSSPTNSRVHVTQPNGRQQVQYIHKLVSGLAAACRTNLNPCEDEVFGMLKVKLPAPLNLYMRYELYKCKARSKLSAVTACNLSNVVRLPVSSDKSDVVAVVKIYDRCCPLVTA
eukprot:6193218-Pleurochrysis_carterae.AAC.2